MEVKRTKDKADALEEQLEAHMQAFDGMVALWSEFDPSLVRVEDIRMSTRKIAGVLIPVLEEVEYVVRPFSLTDSPSWFMEGTSLIRNLAQVGIEAEFTRLKLQLLEHARKKTTQKVNLFEKVQIPGYQDAIRKIKRYLEDEESLSKASQKIMRSNIERKQEGGEA